ncbi:Outer membrane protein OprM [Thalassocella blandensis]|nr:Outer membrane protein OprM [Thalassocella blandensis]
MKFTESKIHRAISAITLMMFISGCAGYRSVEDTEQYRDSITLPAEYSTAGVSQKISINSADGSGSTELASTSLMSTANVAPVKQWWQELKDPQLTQLIEQALTQNYSLAMAKASLEESRALLSHQKLERFPQVQASATGVREKSSEDVRLPGAEVITETYSAGFDASWELDLFGSVHNKVKAAKATLAESEAGVQAMRISVAAETAAAYIDLRGAQHQLDVAQDNAQNLRRTLQLTQRLKEIGRADQLDVSRAQAQLSLTEATIPGYSANITIALNRLSVLTGEHNEQLRQALAESQALPDVPPLLQIGKPAELIRRRPDIQQAEQSLAAAIARYNVRVADLYPSITFNGGLGYLATDLDRLGESSTEMFSFGPSIRWAAFDLGRVHAQIRAADARTQAQVANFKQQVLRALEDTDNALQTFSHEEERRAKLIEAFNASQQSASIAQKKYEIGAENFLSVLIAEREKLNVSAQLAASDAKVLQDLIVVYKNLSGGWI